MPPTDPSSLPPPHPHPHIRRARIFANLMDSAFVIPVIRKRIGLDSLLGLVPVVGDVITMLIAFYMLWIAWSLGLSRWVMARMLLNLFLDTLIGSVPVAGDIFDMVWKANRYNIDLIEKAFADQQKQDDSAASADSDIIDITAE